MEEVESDRGLEAALGLLGTASGGGGPRGWGLLWGEPSKQLVQDDPQGQVTYDLA